MYSFLFYLVELIIKHSSLYKWSHFFPLCHRFQRFLHDISLVTTIFPCNCVAYLKWTLLSYIKWNKFGISVFTNSENFSDCRRLFRKMFNDICGHLKSENSEIDLDSIRCRNRNFCKKSPISYSFLLWENGSTNFFLNLNQIYPEVSASFRLLNRLLDMPWFFKWLKKFKRKSQSPITIQVGLGKGVGRCLNNALYNNNTHINIYADVVPTYSEALNSNCFLSFYGKYYYAIQRSTLPILLQYLYQSIHKYKAIQSIREPVKFWGWLIK